MKTLLLVLFGITFLFAYECKIVIDDDIAKTIYTKKPHFVDGPNVDTYITITKDRKFLLIEWPCLNDLYGIRCHLTLDANTKTSLREDISPINNMPFKMRSNITENEPFEMWIRNIKDCKF